MNKLPDPARRAANRALAALPLAAAVGSTRAQTAAWPNKPLRLVVGFPAGSTTDIVARVMSEQIRIKLGQTAVVENRAGANGVLGASEVARSAGDGYTLLFTNSSGITVNPQVYKKIPYLPERDFTPVMMVISAPMLLVINPNKERTAQVKSLADLLALARANPGQLTYGSGGVGNLAHLGFELVNTKAGIKTAHVPYKGGVASQTGLISSEIDMMFDTPLALPQIKAGKLRALAVATAQRMPELPDVPTFAEAGLPGVEVSFWLGCLAPIQTPPDIVAKLNEVMRGVRDDPNAMRTLSQQGKVELMGAAEFGQRIRTETAAWGEVIRGAKIELD